MDKIISPQCARFTAILVLICQFVPSWWWLIFLVMTYHGIGYFTFFGYIPKDAAYILSSVFIFTTLMLFSIASIRYAKYLHSEVKKQKIISRIFFTLNVLALFFFIYIFLTMGVGIPSISD